MTPPFDRPSLKITGGHPFFFCGGPENSQNFDGFALTNPHLESQNPKIFACGAYFPLTNPHFRDFSGPTFAKFSPPAGRPLVDPVPI